MDVSIYQTERLKKLLPALREFVREEIIPQEPHLLHQSFKDAQPILQALRQKVQKAGWWNLHLPEDLGGMGLTLLEFAHVSEVLAATPYGHYCFNAQAPDIGNSELLMHAATQDQKLEFLLPLTKGEIRSCFSMTEPDSAGSNPIHLKTTAIREGNHYIINGHKWFTSSHDGSAFAIAMVTTNPEHPNPYARASMIIVPTNTPGFTRVRNISIMGHEGDGWMSHAEVKYDNCKVPVENLLGVEGGGFALAQVRLGPGRIHHAMRWIGISERALEMMCRRAAARELAPGVPLASKQTIQNYIAESRAKINAARLMVLHTAQQIDAHGTKSARDMISMIKYFCSEIMLDVVDKAIQVHGALGMTDDTVLSFWYRHERAAKIYDGPDETHKAVVARQEMKSLNLTFETA